jgi:hypothetical protein
MTLNDLAEEGRLPKLAGVLALTAVYWFPVRRWFSRWGTTPEELARVMPGDALIANPTEMSMQAVTVNAPPEDIWPWLVQIGYQRGGLYSYDWLDRLFGFLDRPSATRILPEFQHLAVGDKIRWGRAGTELTVGVLEPLRALALSYEDRGFKWVWQFGLHPLDDQRTRFVTRGSEHVPNNLLWWLGMRIMEPAAFIMTRRFLLGVKERAEASRAGPAGPERQDKNWEQPPRSRAQHPWRDPSPSGRPHRSGVAAPGPSARGRGPATAARRRAAAGGEGSVDARDHHPRRPSGPGSRRWAAGAAAGTATTGSTTAAFRARRGSYPSSSGSATSSRGRRRPTTASS